MFAKIARPKTAQAVNGDMLDAYAIPQQARPDRTADAVQRPYLRDCGHGEDLLAIDDALVQLAEVDRQAADLVKLRGSSDRLTRNLAVICFINRTVFHLAGSNRQVLARH